MTLERTQQLWLLACDGLAGPAELEELESAGERPDWEDARVVLLEALGSAEAPELAQDVMAALGLADSLGPALRQALDDAPAPELAQDVMAALGLADSLGPALREALDETPAPELADDVMAALGLADALGPALREALDDAPAPELADDVMAALGLAPAELDEADLAPVIPLRPALAAPAPAARAPASWNGWGFSALSAAAAAALLIVFTGPLSGSRQDALAFDLSPINHVDIEELSAGDEVMVQVIQQDDNAPTIIFIDELDPSSPDAGGTPL